MKKKLISALMCTVLAASMLTGCGSGETNPPADATTDDAATDDTAADDTADDSASADDSEDETETAEADVVTNTFGDPNGTHLEMWTFVELHGQHYGKMAEVWNEEHPDETIEITCTTYPYADMHTKLLTALQSGVGAPDICDVEVGQFPNV